MADGQRTEPKANSREPAKRNAFQEKWLFALSFAILLFCVAAAKRNSRKTGVTSSERTDNGSKTHAPRRRSRWRTFVGIAISVILIPILVNLISSVGFRGFERWWQGVTLMRDLRAEGQIAFLREGKLCIINASGTGLIRITHEHFAGPPVWSPNGDQIAFTISDNPYLGGETGQKTTAGTEYRPVGYKTSLGVYSIIDGSLTMLMKDDEHMVHQSPVWSPNGRYLVVERRMPESPETLPGWHIPTLWMVNSKTSELTQVTSEESTLPQWFPQFGHGLLYLSVIRDADLNPDYRISLVDPYFLDFNTRSLLWDDLPRVEDLEAQPWWMQLSPNGTSLALGLRLHPLLDIWTYNINSREAQQLTRTGNNRSPTWSPDGQHLAFVYEPLSTMVEVSPLVQGLYTMRSDGAAPRSLFAGLVSITKQCWSPGSRFLTFSSFALHDYDDPRYPKREGLFVYDLANDKAYQLTDQPDWKAGWAPSIKLDQIETLPLADMPTPTIVAIAAGFLIALVALVAVIPR